MINPTPNIAPKSQKFLVLVVGSGEISVMMAWMMEMLPPVIPLTTLERRKIR
jgi:hypothetical protein